MLGDKKKMVADILLAIGRPKKEEKPEMSESEEEPSEMDAGLEAAAEDVLSAIKRSDARALAEAMKALVEMCD